MALRRSDPLPMTYDEYCLLPDDGKRYQVIEGELIGSPSPNFQHQDTVWRLGKLLREFAEANKLGVVVGAPDLCIEVLSPGTGLHDRYAKKAVYARCGVPEYWIVDPEREMVSVFECESDTYVVRVEATGDAVVTSGVLAGFQIAARSAFA